MYCLYHILCLQWFLRYEYLKDISFSAAIFVRKQIYKLLKHKKCAHKNKTIFADNVPLRNMCKCSSNASVTTFIPDRSRVYIFMRQNKTIKLWNKVKNNKPGLIWRCELSCFPQTTYSYLILDYQIMDVCIIRNWYSNQW